MERVRRTGGVPGDGAVSRRDMLALGVAGIAGFAVAGRPRASWAALNSPGLGVTRLTDKLVMVTGSHSNMVAGIGGDGVVLVDGGVKEQTHELLKLLSHELGSDKVRVLFNTHWHHEQTGSNERLGKDGAKIIAHENTKLWLGTDITYPWDPDHTFEPLGPAGIPSETFYQTHEISFGGEPIRSGYLLQAHTDGDIYVHFPKENVLVAGGALSVGSWPFVDWWTGGWVEGLIDAMNTMLKVVDAETKIVSANGPVVGRDELVAQRDMYIDVFKQTRALLYKALSPKEAVAAGPARKYEARMGNSDAFVERAFQSLWGHYTPDGG